MHCQSVVSTEIKVNASWCWAFMPLCADVDGMTGSLQQMNAASPHDSPTGTNRVHFLQNRDMGQDGRFSYGPMVKR